VDHEPLGWGTRTKGQFLEAQRARRATSGPGVLLISGNVCEEGTVTACAYELRTRNDHGQLAETAGVSVSLVVDGQVVRMEQFAPDQLGAALEVAEQLAQRFSRRDVDS